MNRPLENKGALVTADAVIILASLASIALVSGPRVMAQAPEAESERRALAALQVCDPIVKLDEARPGKPVIAVHFRPNAGRVRDDDLVFLKSFPHLRSVDLPNKRFITDAGLAHLAGLNQLEELGLNGTSVTATGVVQFVKGRTRLQLLDLTGVPLRDEELAALKDLTNLGVLSLRETLITDQGLMHLKPLTKLRELSLMSTSIGDTGLEHLKVLTELTNLDLDRLAITDAGLEHLKALHKLRGLKIAFTPITDAGLGHLEGLTSLRSLDLRRTKVTSMGTAKLKERLPELQVSGVAQ